MAESLVKGALGSQESTVLELTSGGVRIETESFVGEHTVSPRPDELRSRVADPEQETPDIREITIEHSEYTLRSDAVDYTVTGTQSHHDEIMGFLERKFCAEPDTHSPENRLADPGGAPDGMDPDRGDAEGQTDDVAESGSRSTMSDGGRSRSLTRRVILSIQRWFR
ncbi:hypothetical protein [Halobacterium bonnevillei]|uniref:Uncharacterized protein n=1 Tax=Halobacterium bonnevillei TaxID=2692200 RepID=A0A6B0SNL4_9EURY|nr:hypothetical protein [Halobacterium bonnevillei]MXR19219.1 hypothetical protein [Halobacterium bonnevillei]